MITYKIHLIRHGQTAGNRDGRYVGRTDLPLCEQGAEELTAMRKKWKYPNVQEVYTSPLLRCRQTADILYPDHSLTVVEDLMELSLGEFEGRRILDLQEDPAYRAWLADSLHNAPPGSCESAQGFAARITQALENIFIHMTQNKITDAAVITHGGVMMGLLSAYGMPRRPMQEWAVQNGAGYTASMSTQMWMRDHLFEVIGTLPTGFLAGGDPHVMDSLGITDHKS